MYHAPVVKKHAGRSPGGTPSHEDERRRSGFRPAARIPDPSPRLEDLADSELDEDTQTSVDAIPASMASSSEAVTDRHTQLPERDEDIEEDDDDEEDDAIPTVQTRVDSAQMLALLAQSGLPNPFEGMNEELLDADTVADAGTEGDPYDDTSPTLPAPPKRPRSK